MERGTRRPRSTAHYKGDEDLPALLTFTSYNAASNAEGSKCNWALDDPSPTAFCASPVSRASSAYGFLQIPLAIGAPAVQLPILFKLHMALPAQVSAPSLTKEKAGRSEDRPALMA